MNISKDNVSKKAFAAAAIVSGAVVASITLQPLFSSAARYVTKNYCATLGTCAKTAQNGSLKPIVLK